MPPSSAAEPRTWYAPPALWVTAPLLVGIAALCRVLWPQWTSNPDLSHGFFTPIAFLLLVAESRRQAPARWVRPAPLVAAAIAALALATVLGFAVAGLLAASVGWSHALVNFVLAATLATALLGGLLCLADERIRLVPLNWVSLTAAGLWLLAAPLPSGTYTRLTVGLQGWVSSGVLNSLQVLGIPARQLGNIIQTPTATVGVEEACSGIRSLLSCVYAGFFLAAWQVRRPAGRTLLILLAPLLALLMNFLRSLTLTLMANAGVAIGGFWHDATGYAILGLTALILAALALRLGRQPGGAPSPAPGAPPASVGHYGRIFAVGAAFTAGLACIFFAYGRPVRPAAGHSPATAASLLPGPDDAPGWHVLAAKDLYRFASILRTTQLAENTYLKEVGGRRVQLTVYVAHWEPGQAPVSLVASHTPDACWPGAGWAPRADPAPQVALTLDGRRLPVAEHRVFLNPRAQVQHVWFWHVYNGRVINYRDPYSVPALLELALRYGFRREGDQYFVRISSNVEWEALAGDPLVTRLFTNLARTGLTP